MHAKTVNFTKIVSVFIARFSALVNLARRKLFTGRFKNLPRRTQRRTFVSMARA